MLVSEEVIRFLTCEAAGESGGPNAHAQQAIQYIETNLAQPISLRDVARAVRLNPDYLGRIFRHHVGESIGTYIRRRRLATAKNLLASDLSVKEAGAAAGFRDALYFSRVFRREEGLSPSEYRATQSESRPEPGEQ